MRSSQLIHSCVWLPHCSRLPFCDSLYLIWPTVRSMRCMHAPCQRSSPLAHSAGACMLYLLWPMACRKRRNAKKDPTQRTYAESPIAGEAGTHGRPPVRQFLWRCARSLAQSISWRVVVSEGISMTKKESAFAAFIHSFLAGSLSISSSWFTTPASSAAPL